MSLQKMVISTSMMLVAVNATASTKQSVALDAPAVASDDLMTALKGALSKKVVTERINGVYDALMAAFTLDGASLDETYGAHLKLAAVTDDSTTSDISSCYSNCYNNCHSACHSSRGWR